MKSFIVAPLWGSCGSPFGAGADARGAQARPPSRSPLVPPAPRLPLPRTMLRAMAAVGRSVVAVAAWLLLLVVSALAALVFPDVSAHRVAVSGSLRSFPKSFAARLSHRSVLHSPSFHKSHHTDNIYDCKHQ